MTSQIEYVKSAWCNLHRHAGRRREQIFLRWTPRPKVPSLSLSKSESWMKVTYLYLALILANFRVLMARGGRRNETFPDTNSFSSSLSFYIHSPPYRRTFRTDLHSQSPSTVTFASSLFSSPIFLSMNRSSIGTRHLQQLATLLVYLQGQECSADSHIISENNL